MQAEIITIGDELLIGQVINTNGSWLGETLNNAGISVTQIKAIADNKDAIFEALEECGEKADLVIITGGLGPTKDDITKHTLSEYFDTQLEFNQAVFDNIVKLFGRWNRSIGPLNRQQAELPKNCSLVPNENGTAAGMWFTKNDTHYISMPGVPFEMKAMMENHIIPKLEKEFIKTAIVHKTVLTQGLPESMLAEAIESWENNLPDPIKLAYLPKPGMVRLRLSAFGDDKSTLEGLVEKEVDKLQKIIPDRILGYGKDTMELIVSKLLRISNKTVATAESCTGGTISQLLTSIPGSSAYFKGAVVAYANEVKENVLGVKKQSLIDHGAVSEEVVKQMAMGVRDKLGTDLSVATTGIAGPDGGTEDKPVGLVWIAIAGPNGVSAEKFLFGKQRERNIQRSALAALNLLRLELLKPAISQTES